MEENREALISEVDHNTWYRSTKKIIHRMEKIGHNGKISCKSEKSGLSRQNILHVDHAMQNSETDTLHTGLPRTERFRFLYFKTICSFLNELR